VRPAATRFERRVYAAAHGATRADVYDTPYMFEAPCVYAESASAMMRGATMEPLCYAARLRERGAITQRQREMRANIMPKRDAASDALARDATAHTRQDDATR